MPAVEKTEAHDEVDAPRVLPPKTLASPDDLRRRRKIGPLGFSHIAIGCKDLEATRHFYEDVIGLPLVFSEKAVKVRSPYCDRPFDMIHFFFELADGSAIGFFGLEKDALAPHNLPANPLQLHFAVQMESEQAVRNAEVRAREAGYKTAFVEHGVAFSLYIDDPDGLQFEMVYHRPGWLAPVDLQEARDRFDTWLANGECWK